MKNSATLGNGRRLATHQTPVRERLESVALDLFAQRHFNAVSIKDIGKAASVNPAMIYYYFKDKEDLFRAALESAVKEAFKLFDEQLGDIQHHASAEAIDAWFDVHVRLYRQLRNVIKISVDLSTLQIEQDPTANPVFEFYRQENEILTKIIQRGITSGEFRSVDACVIATMISTILDGALTRTFILDSFDIAETVGGLKEMMKLYLLA